MSPRSASLSPNLSPTKSRSKQLEALDNLVSLLLILLLIIIKLTNVIIIISVLLLIALFLFSGDFYHFQRLKQTLRLLLLRPKVRQASRKRWLDIEDLDQ